MRKQKFPKDVKFGIGVPKQNGISYIKMSECAEALERFLSEYFGYYVNVKLTTEFRKTDAVYIDGEQMALLFRSVMTYLRECGGVIDINLFTTEKDFMIVFSQKSGALKIDDADILLELDHRARDSGFSMKIIGNTLAFITRLERDKLVISALPKESLVEIFARIFSEE